MNNELELWNSWKKHPSDQTLIPLLEEMNPTIMKRVNMFNTAEVPKQVLEFTAKKLAVEAFQTFEPKKASLKTHTYNHLKQLTRFVGDRQNIGKIPENRRIKITQYKAAYNTLEEELKRDPSFQELSAWLKWPLAEIQRMDAELRGTAVSSTFEGENVLAKDTTRERRIIRNIYYELNPEEAIVYEYLLGERGKPRLTETEIAGRLNMSITKISRIKHKIAKKIEQYL